jgi:predicted membrane channel-forming protein YqfA (hemolysin III family)
MMQRVMNLPTVATPKPLLRGWSHGVAALVAIAGLVALILVTRHDPAKLVSMAIYGTGLVLLFGHFFGSRESPSRRCISRWDGSR